MLKYTAHLVVAAALLVPALAHADPRFTGPTAAARLTALANARPHLNHGTPHLNVTVSPSAPSRIHFDGINKMGGTAAVRPGTQTTFTAPKAVLDMNFGKGAPSGAIPRGVIVQRTSANTVVVTAPATRPIPATIHLGRR